MINNSLEWSNLETDFIRKSKNLSNFREIRKMIDNIGNEVTLLSKAEVEVRQGKKSAVKDILIRVNQDIELLEGYILVAALLG